MVANQNLNVNLHEQPMKQTYL